MVQRSIGLAAIAGIALTLFGPAAQAVSCDIVIDRSGAVVYQDVVPPVDMSERGAAARDRMRQRGEQLMVIDVDQCPRLVFSTITGAASVEEIVSGMRPYVGVSGGMGSSARPGASGTISGGPTSAPGAQPISVPAGKRPY